MAKTRSISVNRRSIRASARRAKKSLGEDLVELDRRIVGLTLPQALAALDAIAEKHVTSCDAAIAKETILRIVARRKVAAVGFMGGSLADLNRTLRDLRQVDEPVSLGEIVTWELVVARFRSRLGDPIGARRSLNRLLRELRAVVALARGARLDGD